MFLHDENVSATWQNIFYSVGYFKISIWMSEWRKLILGSSYATFRGMHLYVDNRKLVNCFVTVMENRIAGRLGETCEISLAITWASPHQGEPCIISLNEYRCVGGCAKSLILISGISMEGRYCLSLPASCCSPTHCPVLTCSHSG